MNESRNPGLGKLFWIQFIVIVLVCLAVSRPVYADQVIADDLIVQGSLGVGFDATNGMAFGFDTIILRENNLRILFDDTSSSASFPKNDWRLTANDSANGGGEFFSIDDATAGRQIFRVDAGAPANSLRVNSSGRVGIKTGTPVLDLHIATGNTPGIRLEQNGSSGFTPQTWDVAGNEANFFIRDVTSGSKLPVRIRPNAPTSSIDVAASGNVGVGTASPTQSLHVRRTNQTAQIFVEEAGTASATARTLLRLSNTGPSRFEFRDTAAQGPAGTNIDWDFRTTSGDTFAITQPDSPSNDFQINPDGSVIVRGTVTANGVLLTSSRELKQDIRSVEPTEAIAALKGLEPVQYAYKATPEDKYVGFIAEDVPDLVASKDRTTLAPMNVVAVVTKVVKDQQSTIERQQQTIADLSARLERLEQKLQSQSQK
jgi:hypothetical protein